MLDIVFAVVVVTILTASMGSILILGSAILLHLVEKIASFWERKD